jgi:hypothetical protein
MLVLQVDLSDYKDSKGHAAKDNIAFSHAQAIADRVGLSADQI